MPVMTALRATSISRKMAIFSALISTISLVGIVSIIGVYDYYSVQDKTENDLISLSAALTGRSSAAIMTGDMASVTILLDSLATVHDIANGCIYTLGADPLDKKAINIIANYPDESAPCSSTTPTETRIIESTERQYIDIVQPIAAKDKVVGYLYLRSNTKNLMPLQAHYLGIIACLSLLGFAIALWLANVSSNRLSQRLLSLETTAHNIISNGNYSLRAQKVENDTISNVITGFNQMLDFFQQQDTQLRDSEEKFRLINETSKVGIFQLDINGTCVYANTELSLITGLPVNEILESNWLTTIHPEDRSTVEKQWRVMLDNNQSLDLNCRLKTPQTKFISAYVRLLRGSDGRLIGYIGTVNDVSEIKNAQTQFEEMAYYDMLTGLANRRLFRNRLEHVVSNLKKEQSSLGLILVDLDSFKSVNDAMGHDAGDKLLKIVAGRLQQCVRASDTVARLSSDEFAIILPGIKNSRTTAHVAEKVLTAIQQPVLLNETEQRLTASIGIAIAPQNGTDAKTIIKNADLALFHAKDKGRNNYQFFTVEMNIQLINQVALTHDLKQAVKSSDFTLVYQPKICLKQGNLVGFEALIRWNHKIRGAVGPTEFIPVAEQTGLIIPLGRWVITTACEQLRTMYDEKIVNESVSMAVNLSAHQFQDEHLVDFIRDRINTFDIKPGQFEIELTESVLMENFDNAIEKLEALRQLGIQISIDDFGTGYSSLGYLKRLPVNTVKVDRSFVTDIPNDKSDMEITSAVIAMAHNLNYTVVAEGVETEQQLQFLEHSGCDYGQGYFFSKPLPDHELELFCANFSLSSLRSNLST